MKLLHQTLRSMVLGGVALGSLGVAAPALAQSAQTHLGIPVDRIGVVGFTIREQIETDARGTLEAVAECGIENIEFSGSGQRDHWSCGTQAAGAWLAGLTAATASKPCRASASAST